MYNMDTIEAVSVMPNGGCGIIYAYALDNGQKYIGQTIMSMKDRHYGHLRKSLMVDNKIRKHGYTLYILNVCRIEFLNEFERYYIKKYNTLYPNGLNHTTGGDSEYHITEERKKYLSEINSGPNHPNYGKTRDKEIVKKIAKSRSRAILQYSDTGEFIKEYESTRQAEIETGIPNSNIAKCLKGDRPLAGGFIWRRKLSDYYPKYIDATFVEEHRKKVHENKSASRKGRVMSEETKRKISEANTGRVFTKEHRDNMSKALKGRPNKYKGTPLSEEHKKKISESEKGKVVSEETKKRISESKKGKPWTQARYDAQKK